MQHLHLQFLNATAGHAEHDMDKCTSVQHMITKPFVSWIFERCGGRSRFKKHMEFVLIECRPQC